MNELYTLKKATSRSTPLKIRVENDDFSAFLAHDLPLPSGMAYGQNYYYIAWLIYGYIGTLKAREAFNVLADKIAHVLKGQQTADLFKPDRGTGGVYHMKDFPYLDKPKTIYTGETEILTNGKDLLFDHARHRIYGARRAGMLTPSKAFDIVYTANLELGSRKSPSDVRSKARNMYEWTTSNIEIGSTEGGYAVWDKERRAKYMREYNKRKVYKMSRSEHMRRVNEQKKLDAKQKVLEASRGLTVKKKNGKLNITSVAEQAGVSFNTAKKHLKEMGLL